MSIKERIENNRFINNLLKFAQNVSLPGFGNVSLYNVGLFFMDEIMRDSINIRAASISYNLFLAFFPLIIFLFTLIPYVPVDNLEAELLHFMNEILPDYTYKTIESTIQDIVNIPRRGLTSVGFFLALFFASNGVSSMIEAFEKENSAFKNEAFYIKKLKAIGITILLTLMLLITLILIIGGQLVLNKIIAVLNIEDSIVRYLLIFIQLLTFFFLTFNSIALIYYLAPSVKDRWSYFSPGVTFTTIVVLLTTYGFTFFINNFNSYNRVYGSIGAIMAVMLLIYLYSMFLIIGFELNASIALNKSLGNKLEKRIKRN